MPIIELFARVQINYAGHVVPGLITKAYNEQPNDEDEAVDVHAFVPAELNVPGNVAFVPGLRHAENKAVPGAKRFIFLGEDVELLNPKPEETPAIEEVAEEPLTPTGGRELTKAEKKAAEKADKAAEKKAAKG